MKVLIIKNPTTLKAVSPDQVEKIRQASGNGEVVLAPSRLESLEHLADAEVVFGMLEREDFLRAPGLRWIHSATSGLDRFLHPEMLESDVLLSGERGLVGEHLADHAFALLLSISRQVAAAVRMGPGIWERDARLKIHGIIFELSGRVMGIVGLGGAGRAVARRATAFGMRTIAVTPSPQSSGEVDEVWGTNRFEDMLGLADVVTICCPLTRETRELFDQRAFAAMKSTALLINVTRGEIVDIGALEDALRTGQIAGAGLDVAPEEPLAPSNPLWEMPNAVITPHTASASQHRADRNIARFTENLRRYRAGQPLEGLADRQKGY